MRMLVRFSRDGSRATVGNRTKMVGSLGVKGKEEVLSVKGELVLKKHTERDRSQVGNLGENVLLCLLQPLADYVFIN